MFFGFFSGVNVEENEGKPHYKKEIHLPNLICFRGFQPLVFEGVFSVSGFFSDAGGAQHSKYVLRQKCIASWFPENIPYLLSRWLDG